MKNHWLSLSFGPVLLAGLPAPALAQAQQASDLTGVFNNLLGHVEPGLLALTAAGFAIGFGFLIAAGVSLKRYGLGGSGMVGQLTLRNPLVSALAGVLLLWLAYGAGIGGQSLFGVGAAPNTVQGNSTVIIR